MPGVDSSDFRNTYTTGLDLPGMATYVHDKACIVTLLALTAAACLWF